MIIKSNCKKIEMKNLHYVCQYSFHNKLYCLQRLTFKNKFILETRFVQKNLSHILIAQNEINTSIPNIAINFLQ